MTPPDDPRMNSLVRGRVSAEDVTASARGEAPSRNCSALTMLTISGRGATSILESADAEAGLQSEDDLRVRVGELLLHELE